MKDEVMDLLMQAYKDGKTQKQMVEIVNSIYGPDTVKAEDVRFFFKRYVWLKKRWNWDMEKARELTICRKH